LFCQTMKTRTRGLWVQSLSNVMSNQAVNLSIRWEIWQGLKEHFPLSVAWFPHQTLLQWTLLTSMKTENIIKTIYYVYYVYGYRLKQNFSALAVSLETQLRSSVLVCSHRHSKHNKWF
jgi:hypothetical protein